MRITRLFIDNYKCFVGFDFKPQAIQPIFGLNGTGKSTLFDFLRSLQAFLRGDGPLSLIFSPRHLTRWEGRLDQTLILEAGSSKGTYQYELKIDWEPNLEKCRVRSETLMWEGRTLYLSTQGTANLHRDDGSRGPQLLVDWTRSGLHLINPRSDNTLLTTFRGWVNDIQIVKLFPDSTTQEAYSSQEAEHLAEGGGNFVDWLRHISQVRLASMGDLVRDLRDSIDGFETLALIPQGNFKALVVTMRQGSRGEPINYGFEELSDGQRLLVALYAVYHGLRGTNAVLCLDEPANYLAISEIQPYLLLLRDAVGDGLAQLLVATHNPEAINDLAPDHPVLFSRGDDGAIQILPFPETNPDGLSAAELIARGWEQP